MKTLLANMDLDETLEKDIKPQLIQGIMNAERSIWRKNDDYPSIPDAWARALFAASMPVKGIQEADYLGWLSAGGVGAGAAAGIYFAILGSNPTGWAILAGAGVGVIAIELGYALVGALIGDLNSTVGRGQISQGTWDDAVEAYGQYFSKYFDKVMQVIDLKTQMERQIKTYKLNDISVKYNPMDKKNVKVLENFMIGAVFLGKIRLDRYKQGRSSGDTIKYALAAYKGASNDMLAVINRKLELPSDEEGVTLPFPAEDQINNDSLTPSQKETLRYVYEAFNYKYEERSDAQPD